MIDLNTFLFACFVFTAAIIEIVIGLNTFLFAYFYFYSNHGTAIIKKIVTGLNLFLFASFCFYSNCGYNYLNKQNLQKAGKWHENQTFLLVYLTCIEDRVYLSDNAE